MTWYNVVSLFIVVLLWVAGGGYIYCQVMLVRGGSDRFKRGRLTIFRIVCGPVAWGVVLIDLIIDSWVYISWEDHRTYVQHKILNWLIGSEYY